MTDTVEVPVKSAWLSKINWTQAVGAAASIAVLASGGTINIPPEQQALLVGAIQGIVAFATWICRTFYNRSVTPE